MTRMDGGKFTVFDRSVLVSNGVLHSKVLKSFFLICNALERFSLKTFFFGFIASG